MTDLFPLCTLHDMPQRSEEWDKMRSGKLTASQAGAWLASVSETKTVKKACDTAINRLLAEQAGAYSPSIQVDMEADPPKSESLRAIWVGNKHEDEALMQLSLVQEVDLVSIGFMEHESGLVGSSPDSLIKGESCVVENKITMNYATQVGRVREGVMPACFRDQVHFQMASTGAQRCLFQSIWVPDPLRPSDTLLDPPPSLQLYIKRDDYTEAMKAGIDRFIKAFQVAADEWQTLNQ